MNIALFGGAFDPPHIGHQTIATTLLEQNLADQVWYVPAADHPFEKRMSPAQHRVAMLQLIEEPQIKVNTYEIEKQGKSYSIETLEHFQQTQPQHTFSWVIGSDQLPSFHKWHRYAAFVKLCTIFVYPRTGFPFEPIFENMQLLTSMQPIDVSSTIIRTAIQKGEAFEQFVHPKVAEYIKNNLFTYKRDSL